MHEGLREALGPVQALEEEAAEDLHDGERLLLSTESGETPPPYIQLILDWTAALKGR